MKTEPSQLWKSYQKEKRPETKEKLILHYVPLVERIVNQMACNLPSRIMKDDLYSYGIYGLLECIDRYDPQMGIPFTHFAGWRIKGAIIDGLRKEDWVPVSLKKKAKLVEEAYNKLEGKLGRNASDQEIAAELGLTVQQFQDWLAQIQFVNLLYLDGSLSEEEEGLFRDQVADPNSPNPVELSEYNEVKAILAQAVEGLPPKERLVVSLFYYHELTNKEIAQVLNLSASRISQLHTKAIFRLRGKLARMKNFLI